MAIYKPWLILTAYTGQFDSAAHVHQESTDDPHVTTSLVMNAVQAKNNQSP